MSNACLRLDHEIQDLVVHRRFGNKPIDLFTKTTSWMAQSGVIPTHSLIEAGGKLLASEACDEILRKGADYLLRQKRLRAQGRGGYEAGP